MGPYSKTHAWPNSIVPILRPVGRTSVARVFKPWTAIPAHPRPEGERSLPRQRRSAERGVMEGLPPSGMHRVDFVRPAGQESDWTRSQGLKTLATPVRPAGRRVPRRCAVEHAFLIIAPSEWDAPRPKPLTSAAPPTPPPPDRRGDTPALTQKRGDDTSSFSTNRSPTMIHPRAQSPALRLWRNWQTRWI